MLALARKVNESIILNDNIEVTVLEVKGDQEANAAAANTVNPAALGELLKDK